MADVDKMSNTSSSANSSASSSATTTSHLCVVRGMRHRRNMELLREVLMTGEDIAEKPVAMHPSRKDRGLGIPDTACRIAVAGDCWWTDYKEDLISHGLGEFITEEPERAQYLFGNDGALTSFMRVTAPGVLAGRAVMLRFSVVKSTTLALLVGRDLLSKFGCLHDMGNRILRMG